METCLKKARMNRSEDVPSRLPTARGLFSRIAGSSARKVLEFKMKKPRAAEPA